MVWGGHSRNPCVLEPEIPRSWCQKGSGTSGASQVLFCFCSENGLVSLVNGGEASNRSQDDFWKSGTFSKHFQGSRRIPNVMCEHDVLSSTVREWKCYTLEHKLDQNEPFVNRQVSCAKVVWELRRSLQNSLDANVSGEQKTIRVDRILNLSSAPPKQGFPPAASNMPSEQRMFLVY